jgi:hypothetical protein
MVTKMLAFRLDHLERQRPSCHRRQPHKLLVLDPLVRLHAIDENIVAEVAPVCVQSLLTRNNQA